MLEKREKMPLIPSSLQRYDAHGDQRVPAVTDTDKQTSGTAGSITQRRLGPGEYLLSYSLNMRQLERIVACI
jgi:hypothetical protein